MKNLNQMNSMTFQQIIWGYYHSFGRQFAWRNIEDPYKVLISEVMLQQTQTHRVIEKYEQFTMEFRSFEILAQASLRDVLSTWQGLGYNRRGKFLHQLAQIVVNNYKSNLPDDPNILVQLPGIGPATAASICAFAFNKPTIFIETNIRAVFLHFFFSGKAKVHDKELMPLVTQTVDQLNPREWYYALMDYGVMLKRTVPNPSRASKHHYKQSSFVGSDRQIRGKIIKTLTEIPEFSICDLLRQIGCEKERLHTIIGGLLKEGIVKCNRGKISIT
jgi:A/G-specific adenine glycosylase